MKTSNKVLIALFFVANCGLLLAQDIGNSSMTPIDIAPVFPGGEDSLLNYVARRIVYPKAAKENKISGVVYVKFVVLSTGEVEDVQVQNGIGGGCNEEAIRVVQEMPIWNPGIMRGKNVKVHMTLPVRFVIPESDEKSKKKKRKMRKKKKKKKKMRKKNS